jgi:hypothetical protein
MAFSLLAFALLAPGNALALKPPCSSVVIED